MTRLTADREIAYEICDVMESMVRTVSKYSKKTKRKTIDEYEKKRVHVDENEANFGQLNDKSSECCKVALWMSDMVANFSHSKQKRC